MLLIDHALQCDRNLYANDTTTNRRCPLSDGHLLSVEVASCLFKPFPIPHS